MQEIENAIQMGNRVSEVINNMASGNFLMPPKRTTEEPKKEETKANDGVNDELKNQINTLTEMLEQKQKEISHVYGSYENLRARINSQAEIIKSTCDEVGVIVSSFQDEIYQTFTSNK